MAATLSGQESSNTKLDMQLCQRQAVTTAHLALAAAASGLPLLAVHWQRMRVVHDQGGLTMGKHDSARGLNVGANGIASPLCELANGHDEVEM